MAERSSSDLWGIDENGNLIHEDRRRPRPPKGTWKRRFAVVFCVVGFTYLFLAPDPTWFLSDTLKKVANRVMEHPIVNLLGHAIACGLLVVLWTWSRRTFDPTVVRGRMALVMALGILYELLQGLVDGRFAQLSQVLANIAGPFVAAVAIGVWRTRTARREDQ